MWYDLMLVCSCPSALVRSFLLVFMFLKGPNSCRLLQRPALEFMLGLGNVIHGLDDSLLSFPLVDFSIVF